MLIATATLLIGCGDDGDDGSVGGPGAASPTGGYTFNNPQTANQDVTISNEDAAAGLATIEAELARQFERDGADPFTENCWMIVSDEGLAAQVMWCGPLPQPDGGSLWYPMPFGAEPSGDGHVISYAPQLIDLQAPTTGHLSRPDGLEAPPDAAPGEAYVPPSD